MSNKLKNMKTDDVYILNILFTFGLTDPNIAKKTKTKTKTKKLFNTKKHRSLV